MATLPPSPVKEFPEDSIEKKIYSIVNALEKNIPLMNDRNRLAFALLNYVNGHGDEPYITVRNNKLVLNDISAEELAKILETKIAEIKK